MRATRSAKATALLLLISLQYTFAAVDVTLCGSSLCFPKFGKTIGATKSCPDGFKLEDDLFGKSLCVKRTPKGCLPGLELKDGKCVGEISKKVCLPKIGLLGSCPSGFEMTRDCDFAANMSSAAEPAAASVPGRFQDLVARATGSGRRLMGAPLIDSVNVLGHTVLPQVILPKPAVSLSIAAPKPITPPDIKLPSKMMPTIVLPQPRISISAPVYDKPIPRVSINGSHNFMPNIVPVLPQPNVQFTVEKDWAPKVLPTINTDLQQRIVTVDLSKLGPKHTVEANLPSLPNVFAQMAKVPDVEVTASDVPKVIDLSGLGPKKAFNVTLPNIKFPDAGSLTIVNKDADKPQIVDLTHLGPKHDGPAFNIKLPSVKTQGANINVVLDDSKIHDVVVPGHGATHNTVINVPDVEWPTKQSKLVVDIKANPGLKSKFGNMTKSLTDKPVKTVNIAIPDIDLSKHLPAGKDVVIEIDPLIKAKDALPNLTKDKMPEVNVTKARKVVDIELGDVEIPRLMQDKTIKVNPMPFNLTKMIPAHLFNKTEDRSNLTTTVINMPAKAIPQIPIPKEGINGSWSVPLHLGLPKDGKTTGPDGMVSVRYEEEWSGGKKVLPNPAAKVVAASSKVSELVSDAMCSPKCCKTETISGSTEPLYDVETKDVIVSCPGGFSYEKKLGKCVSESGAPVLADCPKGFTKCSLEGKGTCVPEIAGKVGIEVCPLFQAVCTKVNIFAKSCA